MKTALSPQETRAKHALLAADPKNALKIRILRSKERSNG